MSDRPLVLLWLVLVACGDGETAIATAPLGPEQAIEALRRETGSDWTVRWHEDLATVAVLEGRTRAMMIGGSTASAEAGARRFVTRHPGLFHAGDAADTLDVEAVDGDELGMVHVRLRQIHQGLPVWGHGLKVHFAPDGALVRIDGRFAPLPPLDHAVPRVSADDARAAGRAHVGAGAASASSELGVDARDGGPGRTLGRLAWRVEDVGERDGAPRRTAAFVDAGTGAVYRTEELLDTLRGSGKGAGGAARTFEVAARAQGFVLEDTTVGSPAQSVYTAGNGMRLPGSFVASDRLDSWDRVPLGTGAAVDAAAWLEATQGYFSRVHGRRGAHGRGGGLRATVHFGVAYPGGFWNGRQLGFGDGDGQGAPATALDLVAHEFAHAVSESAAPLGRHGEAGAVNEAIADLFACFVEQAVEKERADWTIGEDATGPHGSPLRDLGDPRRTGNPCHLREAAVTAEDRGGVHRNATIAGHAGFLIAAGGTNRVSGVHVEGIGPELAERVFYRALVHYLGPHSDWRDLADATIVSARQLAGDASAEARSVKRAWQAVGVLPEEG